MLFFFSEKQSAKSEQKLRLLHDAQALEAGADGGQAILKNQSSTETRDLPRGFVVQWSGYMWHTCGWRSWLFGFFVSNDDQTPEIFDEHISCLTRGQHQWCPLLFVSPSWTCCWTSCIFTVGRKNRTGGWDGIWTGCSDIFRDSWIYSGTTKLFYRCQPIAAWEIQPVQLGKLGGRSQFMQSHTTVAHASHCTQAWDITSFQQCGLLSWSWQGCSHWRMITFRSMSTLDRGLHFLPGLTFTSIEFSCKRTQRTQEVFASFPLQNTI